MLAHEPKFSLIFSSNKISWTQELTTQGMLCLSLLTAIVPTGIIHVPTGTLRLP